MNQGLRKHTQLFLPGELGKEVTLEWGLKGQVSYCQAGVGVGVEEWGWGGIQAEGTTEQKAREPWIGLACLGKESGLVGWEVPSPAEPMLPALGHLLLWGRGLGGGLVLPSSSFPWAL